MRFALMQGGDLATPKRYAEMIEEAVFAEQMGFDTYCVPESHFVPDHGISSPDVFLTAVAMRTSRIKLRAAGYVILKFNHPMRLAEQVATLDVLSGGRVEVGVARSNNLDVLNAFGISAKETRPQSEEALRIIARALTGEPMEHHGEYWDIPTRTLSPTPLQKPHPPIVYCSTGLDGHRLAGEHGIGLMSGGSLVGGWKYVEDAYHIYRDAVAKAKPIGSYVHNSIGVYVNRAYCAETMDEALREGRDCALRYVDLVLRYYKKLAPASPDYAYMGVLGDIEAHKDDLNYINEHGPFVTIGSPDFLFEKFSRIQKLGADEIVLTLDGFGHRSCMRAIELIGERVIPRLRQATGTR